MTERSTSSTNGLTLSSLQIDRLEGIDIPFSIGDLVPGINLVIGPNASGKSRTAAALRTLLWPALSDTSTVIGGRFRAGDSDWIVKINGRNADLWQDGRAMTTSAVEAMSENDRDRYLLSLQDLLHAIDKPLAEQIQKESAGGYDLPRARTIAEVPKSLPKPKGGGELKTYNAARNELRVRQDGDANLRQQEQSLNALEQEIESIQEAGSKVRLIDKAIEHADIVEEIRMLEARIGAFPEPVSRMDGKEALALASLRSQITELQGEVSRQRYEIATAEQALEETGFSNGIPDVTIVPDLRERSSQLSRLQAERRTSATQRDGASAELKRTIDRMGRDLSAEQVAALDGDVMRTLADAMHRALVARGKVEAQQELADWVGAINRPKDIDILTEGITLLSERLRLAGRADASAPFGPVKYALLGAALMIVALSILLALEGPVIYVALALLAAPVIWIAFHRQDLPEAVRSADIEQTYAAMSLDMPAEWAPSAINDVLIELRRRLSISELDRVKADKWASLGQRRSQLANELRENEARRERLRQETGVAFADTEWEALRSLAKDLEEFRVATEKLDKANDLIQNSDNEFTRLLNDINDRLSTVGSKPVADDIEAQSAIEALQVRVDQARAAATRKARAGNEISGRLVPAIGVVESAITDLCGKCGVADDGEGIGALCDQVPAYRDLAEKLRFAESSQIALLVPLLDDRELTQQNRPSLEILKDEQKTIAAGLEAALARKVGIVGSVERARHQRQLEDAAAAEASAKDSLNDARLQSLDQLTAWQIAEFVASRTRDLNRPDVYRAAADLFGAFTAGAFTLEFEDGPPAVFQARDTSSGQILDLNRLSSGTRLQLLFAVRVAFIETRERGMQLPLILDEVLANTDDHRMTAVMDATIEIARRGRQVFYLTAQHDEIAKWHERLRHVEDIQHTTIDLAQIRGRAGYLQRGTALVETSVFQRVAPQATMNHAEAHAFLNVGRINPWLDGLGHASLWYFITDVPALLRAWEFGLSTWGQFESRGPHMLASSVEGFDDIHSRAKLRHRAIDVALLRWREGRCPPLTRQEIDANRLFATNSLEDVHRIAETLDWNCGRLLTYLRTNKVPGVTSLRLKNLEEWMEEAGRITVEPILSSAEIRGYAIAALHGQLSETEIDAVLQSIEIPD